jgi:hypothetical protein
MVSGLIARHPVLPRLQITHAACSASDLIAVDVRRQMENESCEGAVSSVAIKTQSFDTAAGRSSRLMPCTSQLANLSLQLLDDSSYTAGECTRQRSFFVDPIVTTISSSPDQW